VDDPTGGSGGPGSAAWLHRRNLTLQILGQGLGKSAIFVFFVVAPRILGREAWGVFSYTLAVVSLVVQPLVEAGLDPVVTKWVARGRKSVFRTVLRIRAFGGLAAAILLAAVGHLIGTDPLLAAILFLNYWAQGLLQTGYAYFRGIEKMRLEPLSVFLQKGGALLILLVLAWKGWIRSATPAVAITAGTAVAACGFLLLGLAEFPRRGTDGKVGESVADILKEGLYLGGVSLLWLVYYRIDTAMLGSLRGADAAGLYTVAYKLMEGFFFFPGMLMLVVFPSLARRDEHFGRVLRKTFRLLALAGFCGSLLLFVGSRLVVDLLYGDEFSGAARILRVLSWAVWPVYIGYLVTQSLIAVDASRLYFLFSIFSVALNILLNLVLIPRFGPLGAAWATVFTEGFVAAGCAWLLFKRGGLGGRGGPPASFAQGEDGR